MKLIEKHFGTSVESWLEKEGLLEGASNFSIKSVLAWQCTETSVEKSSKVKMADSTSTSGGQLDRVHDTKSRNVT